MTDDPVVERLHRQREELMELYQYDFQAIIALFKNHEAASTAPLLQPPSAPPSVSAERGNGGAIEPALASDASEANLSRALEGLESYGPADLERDLRAIARSEVELEDPLQARRTDSSEKVP